MTCACCIWLPEDHHAALKGNSQQGPGTLAHPDLFPNLSSGYILKWNFWPLPQPCFTPRFCQRSHSRRNSLIVYYAFPLSSVFNCKVLCINNLWISMWISFEATVNKRFRFSSMRICTVNKLGCANFYKKSFFFYNFSSRISYVKCSSSKSTYLDSLILGFKV